MKLSELSGAHIGSRVTIVTPFATITGILRSITSEGQFFTNKPVGAPPQMHATHTYVSVKIGSFEASNLFEQFECTVHESGDGEDV